MKYARIYKSGNSQVLRLPKNIIFDTEQVEIFRRGDEVALCNRKADASKLSKH
jgi:antitoxin VapB